MDRKGKHDLVTARAVHHMAEAPARRVPPQVVVEDGGDLGRDAGARDMRRDGDIVELPEWMLGRKRLGVEDVQHGPADPPFAQRREQRLLVDDGAARDVDERTTKSARASAALIARVR